VQTTLLPISENCVITSLMKSYIIAKMIKYMLTSNVCDSDYSLVRIIYIVLLITGIICHRSYASNEKERCEEISIPMCRGIGYNYTVMPNQFHHDTQEESGLEGKSINNTVYRIIAYQSSSIVLVINQF
jgi:hypothetical protein